MNPIKSFIYLLFWASGAVSTISLPAQANQRLTAEQFQVVAENCANSVNPDILSGLVSVESRFHPYAIGVGGSNPRSIFPSTKSEAIATARELIANGERFDAGIAQINIQNFDWLNLTVDDAFDVCTNLTAAETVLREGYDRARAAGESKSDALRIAISTYNTGHSTRGVSNGYLAETPDLPFTLGEIYRQLTLSADFVKTYRKRIADREAAGKPLSIQTVSVLNDFMSKSENTFEGVKGSITSHLGLYVNPLVDRATSASDFNFADLRKKRMSVYVGITPNNISRLSPLFNLFFQSCVDAQMQELPEHNPDLKFKVLMCMDEFAAAGKMQSFKDGIAFFAGYGLKVLTILQSPSQLSDIYGRDGQY